MITRASSRRHSASMSPRSGRNITETRPKSEEPQTFRSKKRSRPSLGQHPTKVPQQGLGRSDAQRCDRTTLNIAVSKTELTWQQRELLKQSSSRQHRRSRSAASNGGVSNTCTSSLPILRVTSDLEIVAAGPTDLLPRSSRRARSSLPGPHSMPKPQVSRTDNHPPKLYAEPSCFRAPLPQSLPLPCFAKPIKSITAVLA